METRPRLGLLQRDGSGPRSGHCVPHSPGVPAGGDPRGNARWGPAAGQGSGWDGGDAGLPTHATGREGSPQGRGRGLSLWVAHCTVLAGLSQKNQSSGFFSFN